MGRIAAGIAAVACLATSATPVAARPKKPNPAALALFEKAIQASDLKAKGSGAFRLQATAHIFGEREETNGLVVEFWAPNGNSTEETFLPNYNQTDGHEGKTAWTKSSSEYEPYPVQTIWQTLGFVGDLQSVVKGAAGTPSRKMTKAQRRLARVTLEKPRKEKSTNGECVDVRYGTGAERHYCFDLATGDLIGISGEDMNFRFAFGDYQAFGQKGFPRVMHVFRTDGKEMAEIQVTEIDPLSKIPPNLFTPVAGSKTEKKEVLTGCSEGPRVMAAKIVKQVPPIYPQEAKQHRIAGPVAIHAIIGTDGAVHAPWVVKSPSPLLSEAALAAIRQWRYQPTTLCGRKVPVETVLSIIFSLQ